MIIGMSMGVGGDKGCCMAFMTIFASSTFCVGQQFFWCRFCRRGLRTLYFTGMRWVSCVPWPRWSWMWWTMSSRGMAWTWASGRSWTICSVWIWNMIVSWRRNPSPGLRNWQILHVCGWSLGNRYRSSDSLDHYRIFPRVYQPRLRSFLKNTWTNCRIHVIIFPFLFLKVIIFLYR